MLLEWVRHLYEKERHHHPHFFIWLIRRCRPLMWNIMFLFGFSKLNQREKEHEWLKSRPRHHHHHHHEKSRENLTSSPKTAKEKQRTHHHIAEKGENELEEEKGEKREVKLVPSMSLLSKVVRKVEKGVGREVLLELLKGFEMSERKGKEEKSPSLHIVSRIGMVVFGRVLPYLYRFFRLVGSGDLDGDGRVTLSDVGMMSILVDKYCASLPSDVRSVVRLLLERFLKLVREKLSLRGFLTVGEFRRLVLIFLQTLGS